MILKGMVISDQPDSYVSKKGQRIDTQILALIDQDPSGHRLIQSVDYVMNESEKIAYAGKLLDRKLELAVKEIVVFGGRYRLRGQIISVDGKSTDSNVGRPDVPGRK